MRETDREHRLIEHALSLMDLSKSSGWTSPRKEFPVISRNWAMSSHWSSRSRPRERGRAYEGDGSGTPPN